MKQYIYNVKDNSFLDPYFRKHIAGNILKFTPRWLAPNIITILGFMGLITAMVLSFNSHLSLNSLMLVNGALIFFYMAADTLDGMQAKKTKTGSPLGEFCDHFLDIFATGIIPTLILLLFKVQHTEVMALFLFCIYLLQACQFYEQFKTGVLRFDKIGSLEGLALIVLTLITCAFSPLEHLLMIPVYKSYTLFEAILIPMAIPTLISCAQRFFRIPNKAPYCQQDGLLRCYL